MKGFTGGSVVNNLPSNAGNTSLILGPDFPGGSEGKESTCNAGDLSSISGLGRSPGDGNSYPRQYSGLENSMDCIVRGLSPFAVQKLLSLIRSHLFLFLFPLLQKVGHRGSFCDLCQSVLPRFSSKSFIVSGLTFRSHLVLLCFTDTVVFFFFSFTN